MTPGRFQRVEQTRREIVGSERFREGCERLASELSRTVDDLRTEAEKYLEEMVAEQAPFWLDFMVRQARRATRFSYGGRPDYDEAQIVRVKEAIAGRGTVLMPSHKAYLDGMVTKIALRDNGLAPTYSLGGINLDIWPLGEPARKSGTIFLRRDTSGLPVYRWVLREYLGWLVARGESLEWYLEGGRSRTGKLLPPKLGLLVYVIDAYREGQAHDVMLLPMSIIYDQLSDVADLAAQSRGETKKPETLRWAISFLKAEKRHYGRIHVRFGEPLSLRDQLGPRAEAAARDDDAQTLELQKLAFEVSTRINAVTPITGSALVTLVLLAASGRALTLEQLRLGVTASLDEVRRRGLPVASSVEGLDTTDGLRVTVEALTEHGVVLAYTEGPNAVYVIGPDQYLSAAFYRNTAIHHFLTPAIAEVATLHVAEEHHDDGLEAFWDEALRLRDLLKFEFFFKERTEFKAEMVAYLEANLSDWEKAIAAGGDDARSVIERGGPVCGNLVLLSFLEAYMIVAQELVHRPTDVAVERKDFISACQKRGQQYVLQRRVTTPEAVSQPLFSTGLQLADNRGLLALGPEVAQMRRDFHAEIDEMIQRVESINRIALDQFERVIVVR